MEQAFLLRKEELALIISALRTSLDLQVWKKKYHLEAEELIADLMDELEHYDDSEKDIKKRFGIK